MVRALCSSQTTVAGLMDSLGLGALGAAGTLLFGDNGEECAFIKVPDMGRAFGQAMTGELDLLAHIEDETINGLLGLIGVAGKKTV